jgi:hypothetical protein
MPKKKRIQRCSCGRALRLVGDYTFENHVGSVLICVACGPPYYYSVIAPEELALGNLDAEQKEKVKKGLHPFDKARMIEQPF